MSHGNLDAWFSSYTLLSTPNQEVIEIKHRKCFCPVKVTASFPSAQFVWEARSCGILCLYVRRIKRWEVIETPMVFFFVIETHGKKRKDVKSGNLQSADPTIPVPCSEKSL